MLKKLFYFAITAVGLTLISHLTVPTAQAAGTVSVIGASIDQNQLQPVNIASSGIGFTYTINPQTSETICWPNQESFKSSTVKLTSTSDTRNHPIYTLSWSKISETEADESSSIVLYRFNLSIPQQGYELLPNTQYNLKLEGGSSGVEFLCQDGSTNSSILGNFLLQGGYNIQFSTGGDTIAPIITESSHLNTDTSAVLGWITSEPARTQISYGTTLSYGNTKSVPGFHEKHFIELDSLQPGTTYYYRLESKDADGTQTAYKTGSFLTWAISPIVVSDLTGHEATLKWTTSPPTDSIIEYGATTALGKLSGKHNLSTNHDVRLVHLQSNQTYYIRIKLSNGDAESVSEIFSFKTLDASAGVSTDTITINPQFNSQFDFANFNFKDFPEVEPTPSASEGAVLAAQDDELRSIAGNFGSLIEQHRWVLWLWVPILILFFLIACVWMLHRHQHKTTAMKQEILRQKHQPQSPTEPPSIT